MKHVKYDHSNNKQKFFHGGEKLSRDTEKHKRVSHKKAQKAQNYSLGFRIKFLNSYFVPFVPFCG